MSYVIYHKETTRILGKVNQYYATMGAARAALTRYSKKWAQENGMTGEEVKVSLEQYGIAETNTFFDTIEKKVERTNLMSGDKFMEPVNTPGYMSPASESYWSM